VASKGKLREQFLEISPGIAGAYKNTSKLSAKL
jgi:hypothetical protein